MPTARRVIKNSLALVTVTILERGVGFTLTWYIARALGAEAMGEYSTALSWLFVALPLAIWGFDQLLLREMSRNQNAIGSYIVNAGSFTLITSAATAGLLLFTTHFFSYSPALNHLLRTTAVFVLPLYAISLIFETAIKSLERMEWLIPIRIPLMLLRVGGSIYLLSHHVLLDNVFLLLGIYYGSLCLIYWRVLCFLAPNVQWSFDPRMIRKLAVQSIPIALIGVLGITFKQVDRIMLSALSSMENLGINSTGASITAIILLTAPALMESLFPSLARIHLSAPQEVPTMISRLLRLIWVIAIPVMLITITFVKPVILLLFTVKYIDSVLISQILSVAIVPAFLSRLLYRVILASNNEKATLRIAAVNSVIGICLNLILIPTMGLVGAGIAAVSTESAGFLQNLHYVRFRVAEISIWETAGKPFLCALVSIAGYYIGKQWNEYGTLAAALAIFWGSALCTRLITFADFSYRKALS